MITLHGEVPIKTRFDNICCGVYLYALPYKATHVTDVTVLDVIVPC